MNKVLGTIGLVLFFILSSTAPASAVTLTLGSEEPVLGGSWTRTFNLGGIQFDSIFAFIVSGDTEFGHSHGNPEGNPGLYDFSNLDWHSQMVNGTFSNAWGQESDDMNFSTTWSADVDKEFEMHVWLSDHGSMLGGFSLKHLGYDQWEQGHYDGFSLQNWADHVGSYDQEPKSVPEPGTFLLFGVGLIGLVVLRKNFSA